MNTLAEARLARRGLRRPDQYDQPYRRTGARNSPQRNPAVSPALFGRRTCWEKAAQSGWGAAGPRPVGLARVLHPDCKLTQLGSLRTAPGTTLQVLFQSFLLCRCEFFSHAARQQDSYP